MKRLVTAVSFAVLAVPAVAAQPFEQTELDRALPQVNVKARGTAVAAQPWVDYNFIAPAL